MTNIRDIKIVLERAKVQHLVAIAALVALNIVTYWGHYRGHYAFPWDFLGGYHAQSFGWFDQGSILAPPAWLPWSDLGFPSSMALQSGAWYLPLAALDAAGIPYTVRVAVAVQCLHVLVGAAGIYALGRRAGLGLGVALLGAVAFHSSATFYSNQQHVDIVRAVALLPWLLFLLHPGSLRSRWGVPVGGLLLSQLLISGYPGNIVAAAYACALWCFFCMMSVPRSERLGYAMRAAILVVIGALVSMVKWYPVLTNIGAVGFERWEPRPIEAPFLATILFAYERDFLPSDITMRSLWLPLTVLLGITFARTKQWLFCVGIAFAALALAMAMVAPHWDILLRFLPGMTASRWLISDWRPVLQIGLLLAGCAGWQGWRERRWSRLELDIRVAVAALVILSAMVVARGQGYAASDFWPVAAIASIVLIGSRQLAAREDLAPQIDKSVTAYRPAVLMLSMVLIAAVQGYLYNFDQAAPWRMPWSSESEAALYGRTVESWMQHQAAAPSRRPERMLLGELDKPQEAIDHRTDERYNQCWYGHSYCVLGYNNIRLSLPHKRFVEVLQGPSGADFLAFVSRPQQLWVAGGEKSPPRVQDAAVVGGDTSGITAQFAGYKPDRIDYILESQKRVTFVENEIWWKGWEYRYCNNAYCSPWSETVEGPASLRSWTLPEGRWHVTLRFKDESVRVAMILAAVGFLIGIFWFLGHGLRLRRPTGERGRSL